MKYFFDAVLVPSERMEIHECRLVVDLLRASTQITTFFEHGGRELIPCSDSKEAIRIKADLGQEWALMGERGGVMIPGFDYGNSPVEIVRRGAPEKALMTTSKRHKSTFGGCCGLSGSKGSMRKERRGSRMGCPMQRKMHMRRCFRKEWQVFN